MFIIVRTKDQIKKTEKFFNNAKINVQSFAISSTVFHKVKIEKEDEAFIVTSPNAVLSIPQTKLPFFCVGEASANEAKETGRRVLYSGNDGAEKMAIDISKKFPPQILVHAAGDTADISWHKILEEKGNKVIKRLAYETKYTEKFDTEILDKLNDNSIESLVFFSPKGAINFTNLLKNNDLNPSNYNVIAFSEAVATHCGEYKDVYISSNPNLEAVKYTMLNF